MIKFMRDKPHAESAASFAVGKKDSAEDKNEKRSVGREKK